VNPDELSLNETERAIDDLREKDLAVRGLVANKLTPSPDPDENGRGARYLRERVETKRNASRRSARSSSRRWSPKSAGGVRRSRAISWRTSPAN